MWRTVKIRSNIIKGPRSSASVRHQSPSWKIHGVRHEREGGKLDWWSFDSGYWRSQNNATIWNSREKASNQKRWTFSREATNLYSHAGRAKYCKNGCRSPSLCTKRRATSGENLNTILHKKKEEPEIQIYLLKFDKISVLLWNITYIYISESRWYENETPCSSRRFSDTSESHWCPETWKRAVMHFKKRPSMTIGTWMPISHCLNLDRCHKVRVAQQKSTRRTCGFKSDWRRNRSAQDLDILGRENGEACRKHLSAKR